MVRSISGDSGVRVQSSQARGLSWQYALLLPCWVRPSSSPAVIMGTPREIMSEAIRLRLDWARRARMSFVLGGSPSKPWL